MHTLQHSNAGKERGVLMQQSEGSSYRSDNTYLVVRINVFRQTRETIPRKAITAGAIYICSKKVSELISFQAAVTPVHLFQPYLRADRTDKQLKNASKVHILI